MGRRDKRTWRGKVWLELLFASLPGTVMKHTQASKHSSLGQIFKGSFGKVSHISVPDLFSLLMPNLAAIVCLQVRPKKQHSSDGWWNVPADELNPIPIPYPPRQRSPAPT